MFKGEKIGFVLGKCKGMSGWVVELVNPESPTKTYCISPERGDKIVKVTKNE